MPTISFTGTDLATLQASDANVTKIGTGTDILINANTGYAGANAAFSGYYSTTAPAGADQTSTTNFTVGNAAHTGPGVCLRMDTAGNNLYWANFNGTAGWVIRKRVAGTFSLVASYVGDTPLTGPAVEFSVVGTALKLYVAGVLRIDTTDTSHSAAGQWGVGTFFADASNGRYIDNAIFSDVASGATGTIAVTLVSFTSGASGTTTIVGTIANTLATSPASFSGTTSIIGTMDNTLATHTSDMAGTTTVPGTLATTLENFISEMSGSASVSGTIAYVLEAFSSAIAATTTVVGTMASTLANFTSIMVSTVSAAITSVMARFSRSGSIGSRPFRRR